MKKSEMLDIIENVLYDSWEYKSGDRHIAGVILNKMEDAGMLPPLDYNNPDPYAGLSDSPYHNTWEPEDEESV